MNMLNGKVHEVNPETPAESFRRKLLAANFTIFPGDIGKFEDETLQKEGVALRVAGESMIGRHILDGDIVVLEHGPEPRNGQIVAALIDGDSTLKTFVLKGGKAYLKAENPKYPNLIPAQELMIQGVFRAMIRKAKE